MTNREKLEIPLGQNVNIELLFDEPKTGMSANGEWRLYGVKHNSIEKGYFASDKAHEMLQHYKRGDIVNIKHKSLSDGKSMYEVTSVNSVDINSDLRESSVNSVNDKDMAIKWGMAFNNATRLVANISTDESVADKVALIKDITPSMFEIACSMPMVEKEEIEKNDDDLPF